MQNALKQRIQQCKDDDTLPRSKIRRGAAAVWEKYYVKRNCVNMGLDRIQDVLYRLENGALAGIQPKVVVLLIGTNNTDSIKVWRAR